MKEDLSAIHPNEPRAFLEQEMAKLQAELLNQKTERHTTGNISSRTGFDHADIFSGNLTSSTAVDCCNKSSFPQLHTPTHGTER